METKIPGLNLEAFLNFTTDPTRTADALLVQKTMLEAPNRPKMVKSIEATTAGQEEFQKLYRERYVPVYPTMTELNSCPDGSFGKALWRHLHDNNIHIDFAGLDTDFVYRSIESEVTYMGLRAHRNHDVFHVALGLGITPLDEYCLAAAQAAQFRSAFHSLLISAGLIYLPFQDPENIGAGMDRIFKYYQLGKKMRYILGYKFEENWNTPLEQVQMELGLSKQDLQN